MRESDSDEFIVLDDNEAEAMCSADHCIRHGAGTIACPVRLTESRIIQRLKADDSTDL